MRRNVLLRLFLAAAVLCILLPAAVLVLWSAAARWRHGGQGEGQCHGQEGTQGGSPQVLRRLPQGGADPGPAAVLCILLPAAVLVLWSAAARWSWPSLLPERWSARTVRELLFGSQDLWRLLGSSMSLGSGAAGLSTLIGLLTARAVSLYDFPGKGLVRFAGLLPLLIPGTVFATGIHLVLLRLGLADTAAGVLLGHVMTALPYSISIGW